MTIAVAACLLFVASGCTVLAPQQDHSRFFILTPASDGVSPIASAVNVDPGLSIGVGPVRFPGYLKRAEIVTRVSADQLELSQENRWAEPLDSNFQRVLGQDLSQMLGTQRIVMFPWYAKTHVDYQVEVYVHRFETGSDGRSQLDATWVIKDGKGGADLFAEQTTTSSAVGAGDGSGSVALSRDVSALSRQIAERISDLNHKRSRGTNAAGSSRSERGASPAASH